MHKHTLKRKTVGLLVAAMLMLGAMPGIAAAQDTPTSNQYDPSTIVFNDSAAAATATAVSTTLSARCPSPVST